MDKEKEPETTWERVSNLNLPTQVRVLCDCLDEANSQIKDLHSFAQDISEKLETKSPKK